MLSLADTACLHRHWQAGGDLGRRDIEVEPMEKRPNERIALRFRQGRILRLPLYALAHAVGQR